MSIRNQVHLVGHLGADPEIKKFESGSTLANFRVATNENFKTSQGEWQTETTWHRVVCWGGLAERAEKMLVKGSYVLLQGKLSNRDYTDKNGDTRYITEVKAISFVKLDKEQESMPAEAGAYAQSEEDNDLPF